MRRARFFSLMDVVRAISRNHYPRKKLGFVLSMFTSVLIATALLGASSLLTRSSHAQGTVYVQIDGIPPVLESPLLSEFERKYRQGSFRVQFVFISPTRQPRPFQFKLTLEHDGEQLIEMDSEPISFEPGVYSYATFDDDPAIIFPLSYDEWLGQLNPELANTGILSEGDYLLKIEALPTDPNSLIPSIPGVALFTVRYAEPPLLLTPPNEAHISAQLPIFSWTPVTGAPLGSTMEYELLITEVLSEQTPAQALESNIEQAHKALIEQTSFVYSPNELPLEPGKVYAWQVQARDVNDQLPILDRGATEIYTFSILGEGLGTGLTAWSFPISSPFLRYDFENNQEIDASDVELFFDDYLPIDLLGLQTNATFERVLIDVETQRIIEGAILIDDAFGLEIAINPLNDSFSGYKAVSSGSDLTLDDGVLLDLGSDILIDSRGLQPKGSHLAQVSYSGYGKEQWTATYSEDLVLDFSPFTITSGRIDFAADGVAKGYADPSGFYLLSQSDPVIAQLPDRLLIDGGELGYISLKNGPNALVSLEEKGQTFEITGNRAEALDLMLPNLQNNYHSQPPRFSAQLENVIIDAATGELIEGSIVASRVDSSSLYTLDAIGIPIAPREFRIERSGEATQVQIEGIATLFGQPINNIPSVTLDWDTDHVVRGTISQDSLDGYIWLNPENQDARLSIASLEGTIHAPLNSSISSFQLDIEGQLELLAHSELAARADISATFDGHGYGTVHYFEATPLESSTAFAFNEHALFIDEISSFDIYYSPQKGIEYRAGLQSHIESQLIEGGSLIAPLQNTELTEMGISFPNQEIHEGIPGFQPAIFNQGKNRLELAAVRIPATQLSTNETEGADTDFLTPEYDFELQLLSDEQPSFSLSMIPFTVQSATLQDGIVSGPILAYTFNEPLVWHFNAGVFEIHSLSGSLLAQEGKESENLFYSGVVHLAGTQESSPCETPAFYLTQKERSLDGYSTSFTPCTPFTTGRFSVELGESTLRVQTSDATPSFFLEGELLDIASLTGGSNSLKSPGQITLDLSTNTVVSAEAEINRIDIQVPYNEPLYTITLEDVVLNEEGFSIQSEDQIEAQSLIDGEPHSIKIDNEFTLGWLPEISNRGRSELIKSDVEDEVVTGFFDHAGFHPLANSSEAELPERIALPGVVEAYLVFADDEDSAVKIGKKTRDGTELTSSSEQSVFLSIPFFSDQADPVLFPVSIDILLNDAFAYTNGEIAGNYESDPIDLEDAGYPLRIRSIKFDPNHPEGHRLHLEGELRNPEKEAEDADGQTYFPFDATLSPNGFSGILTATSTTNVYPDVLDLKIRELTVDHSKAPGETVRFYGELISPLFSSPQRQTYIGIEGSYDARSSDWRYELASYQPSILPIGATQLHVDSRSGYSLNSDSELDVTIAGTFKYAGMLDPGFTLGAILDIGKNGIELWPNDDLWIQQPLFGGILSTSIDALDIVYDADNNRVLTTIDGAFIPQLSVENSNDNVIPFSGIQLSSEGTLSITGDQLDQTSNTTTETEALELLTNLSPIKLINDAFLIESLRLVNDSTGLNLDLSGRVTLPNYRSYAPGRNLSDLNPTLPVSMTIGYDGTIEKDKTFWNGQELAGLQPQSASSNQGINYSAVDLDFDPRIPSQAQILASATLSIENFVTASNANQESSLSIQPQHSALEDHVSLSLGSHSDPNSHPGIRIQEQATINYLITDYPTVEKPLFKLRGDLTDVYATKISLDNSAEPIFTVSGRSMLTIDGFSGYFPIKDMTIDPRGVTDLGSLSAPSALAFQNIASFELNCFENQQNSVSALRQRRNDPQKPSSRSVTSPVDGPFDAQIRFGTFCGSSLPITLTDRWFAGTFDEFNVSNDTFSSTSLQVNGVDVQFSDIASFKGTFTFDDTSTLPYFQMDGETLYQGVELTSTGSLKSRNGLPSLSILFSPARQPLEIIPNFGYARIPGGGIFFRPTESEIELVSLALNERSNNSFSSNYPGTTNSSELNISDQLSLVTPVEFALESGRASLDFNGIGVLRETEQFTYLDLDGAFYDDNEKLRTDLFLVQREGLNSTNPSLLFEGLSNISLNYSTVVGGVIPGNFSLSYSPDSALSWSANGYSEFILSDTIKLPGHFLMNPSGFALTLQDEIDIDKGHFSVDDEISVFLWQLREQEEIQGYTSFTSSIDLLPGYMLNEDRMNGALIKDRDEYQFYAARNQYADVPFIFNGPIDPWLAFQDGGTFGGDARNSVFLRMLQDARASSQKISGLTEQATSSLQNALDLQKTISESPIASKEFSLFSKSRSTRSQVGQRIEQLGSSVLSESYPSALQSILKDLYDDENHPELNYVREQAYASEEASEALAKMRSSIDQARKSADLDIYSFQTISPRPLLWLADNVDLTPELEDSPFTIPEDAEALNLSDASFQIDLGIASAQTRSLIAFKQNNESIDSQFIRAIGGLENNLVNLKTVRTPEQAFDFESANGSIRQFYAQQISDDWTMLEWSKQKTDWLTSRESTIEEGIRTQFAQLSRLEDAQEKLKKAAIDQYNLAVEIGENTSWQREDLPEGTSYTQYVNTLSEDDVEAEFVLSAKNMWFDAPLASLTELSDSLTSLISERIDQFEVHSDTLNKVSDNFSKALDPLYDVQTQYTTTLFGMADEYRIWRSSIRGLDPDAVDYSFQFTPYRGNYRILAEDLTPPVINDIVVSPSIEGFLSHTSIEWETDHPVELAEISLSVSEDTSSTTYFTSLATSSSTSYFTTKSDSEKTEKDISLTLRVRGAGGVPVIKQGQFSVDVSPTEQANAQQEITLVPFDSSPPPSPTISGLEYSSYFGETTNTVQFKVEALRDIDSGIERVEYKIENENGKDLIQDWTSLPFSTTYFGGRVVETSLPVQEDEITVKISVRITNGSGLTSIAAEELELDLDVSPPTSSVKTLLYYDEFENTNQNSLAVEVIDIADQESGIDRVEYTITKEAQANLANAIWDEFLTLPNRPQRTGSQTIYLPLADEFITDASNNLSIFIRATNGAGLQNVIRETIQIPGKDTSSPTEPSVTLEHTGFYSVDNPNQLRIIVGNSSDFESGIGRVLYRVLDGQNGQVIYDWDDFLIISPGFPTYIIPTTDKHISLPRFDTSRSIIVEVQSYNRAGLASTKAIRFLQTELDLTPPTEPQVSATYYSAKSPFYPNSILLDVGRIEDKEAPIVSVEYRIVNIESPQRNQEWIPLDLGNQSTQTFPGSSSVIAATSLAPNTNHIIQVRATNLQGLSNIVDVAFEMDADDTPPVTPALLLNYTVEPELNLGNLELTIGESRDPQSFISRVRYRISDLQQVDSLLLNWQEVSLDQTSNQFDGVSVQHNVPLLNSTSRYLVDVEVINGMGLSSRSSAIIDHNLINAAHLQQESSASIDLFYFDSTNEIRSSDLEVIVHLHDNFLHDVDSLQYRIDYTNDETAEETTGSRSSSTWTTIQNPKSNKAGQYRFYAPVQAMGELFSATAHVRLFAEGSSIVESEHSIVVSNTPDITPPSNPDFDVINYGVHHPSRANQLDLVINAVEDTQSRISEVSYRLVNKENGSESLIDWTPISFDTSAGLFSPRIVSLDLPEFNESVLLAVEVRSTNGNNLTATSELPVSVIVDTTPPVFEDTDIFVRRSNSQPALNQLYIQLFGVSDQESQISSIDYRVSIEQDSSELIIDWTPIDVPNIQHVSFPEIQHDLPESEHGYTVLVELKATNLAGLTTNFSETIKLDNDTSPPQIQDIEATYKLTISGSGYVLIEPGSFRDPESQITHIEYRIVDASDELVYQEWKSIPLQKDIRVQVNPITIPRLLLPFDATREVNIEFRAFNGFGLSEIRRTTLEVPGDTTPPEASSLSVRHRNGYDPRHPNTIEIQVGPTRDDQSSIEEAQYRIINLATSEELLPWTSLPVSNDGSFPGKVIFADLPFLSSAVDMRVEVEISNSAGLVRSVSENVTIQVAGDLTPPSIEIQSHYFSNSIAIVLDELSDPHSRIQKVEYRLVDNVDQSVLADWVDLFEIASPQERYSRQSYSVRPPEIRAGRAVKIEVRATNGAGLQSTVSKTILYQEPDSN